MRIFSCLIILFLISKGYSAAYTFNVANGNWNVSTNWMPNGIPGTGDVAIIGSGKTVTLVSDVIIDKMTISGGTVSGNFNLRVDSLFSWSSGTVSGTGVISVFGEMNSTSGNSHNLARKELHIYGSANFNSPLSLSMAGTKIIIKPSGILIWDGNDGNDRVIGGSPTQHSFIIENGGTFSKSSRNKLTIEIPFNNAGTLKGEGSIIFNSTFVNSGIVSPGPYVPSNNSSPTLTLNKFTNANSKLFIEISGKSSSQKDSLKITGSPVALTGTLELALTNGFVPDSAQQFTFLSMPSSSDIFLNVIKTGLPDAFMDWKIIYEGTNVSAKYCPIWYYDNDGDGYGNLNNPTKIIDCIPPPIGFANNYFDRDDLNPLDSFGIAIVDGALNISTVLQNNNSNQVLTLSEQGEVGRTPARKIGKLPDSGLQLSNIENDSDLENDGYSILGKLSNVKVGFPAQGGTIYGRWKNTSITNAPSARSGHTAIWTGTEMIVWGGVYEEDVINMIYLNTGSKYNPTTDTWTAINLTNAPSARSNHTTIWTGTEMIVWGGNEGSYLNTGSKYNPTTNTWTAINLTNAPSARSLHTAIWTGTEMIVWGGYGGSYLNIGSKYNPTTNTWTAINLTNAPSARSRHTAIWTGTEMIVWGGNGGSYLNTGSKYNPATDTWTAINLTNAPSARSFHTAIWTGTEMIVWGGNGGSYLNTGSKYNPTTYTWTVINDLTNTPNARSHHTAIWTGTEMIVWGGYDSNNRLKTGAKYYNLNNTWTPTSDLNFHNERSSHTVVWTGTEMIVWGGYGGNYLNTGSKYNPFMPGFTHLGYLPPFYVYKRN
jgi:N-acetylneuraminic acid mutarotase